MQKPVIPPITVNECFTNENLTLVILVNSGLKNDQGGLDFNPYGEVRIFGTNGKIIKEVAAMMHSGLSKKDKLSQKTHEMVRVCKKRGMAISMVGLFKTEEKRFQPIEVKNVVKR